MSTVLTSTSGLWKLFLQCPKVSIYQTPFGFQQDPTSSCLGYNTTSTSLRRYNASRLFRL